MKQYSTYIFDLDGTLLNTLQDLYTSCNYALTAQGYPARTIEEIRQYVGNGVKTLIEKAVPEGQSAEQIEETLAIFREHYMLHGFDTTEPYEGIIAMLAELKRRNNNIAVVSNKFYDATKQLCNHFFADYVNVAIGEKENIRKKPAPGIVYEALRQLGVSTSDAVFVGDSDVDIVTAQNCDIPCISVLWGFRDKDFLESFGASDFANRPEDLLE